MEAFTYLIPGNSKCQNSQTEHKQVGKDHHNIQRCHHCKDDRFYYKLLNVLPIKLHSSFVNHRPNCYTNRLRPWKLALHSCIDFFDFTGILIWNYHIFMEYYIAQKLRPGGSLILNNKRIIFHSLIWDQVTFIFQFSGCFVQDLDLTNRQNIPPCGLQSVFCNLGLYWI